MDADGSHLTRLTHNLVEDNGPSWTPDGRILFGRDVSGNATQHQLFVINPDGTGEMPYPPGGPATYGNWPVCSPDGTKIAYTVRESEGRWDLWVMDADTLNKVRLTDLGAWISAAPSWSPDGTKIVFVANQQIYIIYADGSSGLRPEPIVQELRGCNSPVWRSGSLT